VSKAKLMIVSMFMKLTQNEHGNAVLSEKPVVHCYAALVRYPNPVCKDRLDGVFGEGGHGSTISTDFLLRSNSANTLLGINRVRRPPLIRALTNPSLPSFIHR
jgi:hypothetical protein